MLTPACPCDETLIFDNALAHVTLHRQGYVYLEWQIAPVVSNDFRAALVQAMAALRNTGATSLLMNASFLGPIWEADIAWLGRRWVRAATGIRCAVVEALPGQLAGVLRDSTLLTQRFTCATVAVAWLRAREAMSPGK